MTLVIKRVSKQIRHVSWLMSSGLTAIGAAADSLGERVGRGVVVV